MEVETCDADITVTPGHHEVIGSTRRQRSALAVVRSVIGDGAEQLEVLRRISVGLPVKVNEVLADGSVIEHALKPGIADVRAAAAYLIERRWGRVRWADGTIGEEVPAGAVLAGLPEGARVRLRTLARELVLDLPAAGALEKGHSPRDEAHDAGSLALDLVPVWPAQGGGVPAPSRAEGGGGPGKWGPIEREVGPSIEGRSLKMPAPLPSGNFSAGDSPMPAPCSICGHRHEVECEEYMPGFGRSCRCPVYVDGDVTSEEVTVVSPEMQVVADGMALAARAEVPGRCGCGHELREHFATRASTRCVLCVCKGYRERKGEVDEEAGLMAHYAAVAKRVAE